MKTSALIGPALDWAVAKCEGYTNIRWNHEKCADRHLLMTPPRESYGPVFLWELGYSTDWSQGGPIIERESIYIMKVGSTLWRADCGPAVTGPTPLIAAMRYAKPSHESSPTIHRTDHPPSLKHKPAPTNGCGVACCQQPCPALSTLFFHGGNPPAVHRQRSA